MAAYRGVFRGKPQKWPARYCLKRFRPERQLPRLDALCVVVSSLLDGSGFLRPEGHKRRRKAARYRALYGRVQSGEREVVRSTCTSYIHGPCAFAVASSSAVNPLSAARKLSIAGAPILGTAAAAPVFVEVLRTAFERGFFENRHCLLLHSSRFFVSPMSYGLATRCWATIRHRHGRLAECCRKARRSRRRTSSHGDDALGDFRAVWRRQASFLRRPPTRPSARAAAMPAEVRSRIAMARSKTPANEPIICIIMRPAGVVRCRSPR